jgi:arsenite methyltransferase
VGVFADIKEGDSVLDIGCGSGLDSFLSAYKTGPDGTVTGMDFSSAMISRAVRCLRNVKVTNLVFIQGEAENFPVKDNSVDVVLTNGIFNLNPFRENIFNELALVLRRGGRAYAAELIASEELPQTVKTSETDWFK